MLSSSFSSYPSLLVLTSLSLLPPLQCLSPHCLHPALQLKLLFRLREVADGMSYLHKRDVVHGDLKSGNVLLCVSPASAYGRMAKVTE
jgi:serine/threonine protein kinase